MYQPHEMEQLSQEIKSLLKQHGFDQFVLVAHNCQKERNFICATPKPCGFMHSMNTAVQVVNQSFAPVKLASNNPASDN